MSWITWFLPQEEDAPELTVVVDAGDFLIAAENYPLVAGEDDPGNYWDGHDGDCYFGESDETGRTYCEHGYWYDSHVWGEV